MSSAAKVFKKQTAIKFACVFIAAFAVPFCVSTIGHAQTQIPTNNGSQNPRRIPQPRDPRDLDDQIQTAGTSVFYEKRIKMLNAEQHKSMVADTDRLVKLVADLNSEINNSKSSLLTPDQLRTVAEIEKLAHNIRDKMRMSVRSAINDGTSDGPFVPR